ncbi:23 kDa integral membrane protein-like [Spodoptera litura]|uniref:23 kDa integral membrane protein-like n=1 Tax=Spodoptera litura TaxID=69820 RepID=A0A9J7DWX6_SPOLT|nr:23 kDa integral membrane protein-like [Spodoptera litura]
MRVFRMRSVTPVEMNASVGAAKTETEYNMKSIRCLLMIITAMFIVVGGLMIVLGISVYSHFHSFSSFYESGMIRMTPSTLSVFIGLALLIISIFGFFGSLKLSTCMVNVYAVILMLVFIVKLVVVILAFTTTGYEIWRHINVPVHMYSDPEVQEEIDMLQSSFSCCGSYSYMDYLDVVFGPNQPTLQASMIIDGDQVSMTLPRTCCLTIDGNFCQRVSGIGCKDALVNAMVQNSTVIGVLGISVMFINLLGIIFALLLARSIRKLKSVRVLLAWKVRERVIVARQAEERQQTEANQVYIDPQSSSTA